ncbi:MAG: LysM peptidoglycan-binding domain-containing protein [Bacteroidetes bacterium]|nr:LysM peptidoglycan-binding domain-containing protein [Bacteroidota bacterium]
MIGIIKSCYSICIVSIGIMLFHAPPASAQTVTGGQNGKTQQVPEVGNEPKNTASKVISEKLEKARQKYLKALTAIENDDTLSIPRLFEDAVQALNSLASYPGIESNEDFADLAQSIIDDYESYVQIIDSLPESSSAFMLRNKIYQEVEDIDPASPSMSTMQFTSTRVSGAPGVPGMTIPLDINEYVQKNITFLSQDKGRKFFKRWIEKSTRWFPLLKRIAREEDMPEDIIYLSMIESALNPNAVSWAKAVGMWQFMQAAASDYGLTMNSWVDERRDPEKSTRAAMRYLKWLYNEFGDWHLALAAYNSGPNGPVRRGISRIQKDAPTFWDIREYLPKETKNYVPLYIATAVICLNQEQYGFTKDELTFEPEYQYETHPIDGSISLKVIAQCLNESIEQVKELNPELVGTTTPPNSDEPYELKIPVGKKELFAQNLAKLSPEELNPWVLHSVEKGETIADIAAKYAVNTQDITSNNSISSGSKLKKGMSIRIPREALGTAVLTANTPSSDTISGSVSTIEQPAKNSVVESNQQQATVASQVETPINTTVPKKNTVQNDLLVNASPSIASNQEKVIDKKTPKEEVLETEKPTAISITSQQTRKSQIIEQKDQVEIETKKSGRAHVKHIVRSGESLYTLAQKYGVRMTDLRNWNGISFDTDQLTEGQELIVSSTASPKLVYIQEQKHKSPTQTVKRGNKHTVKRGETLAQIADDYGIDIESLRKANNIKKSGTIRSGTILRIPKQSFSDERSTRAVSKKRTSGSTLKVHSLKKGETLSKIAALYNVSEKDLRSWNPGIKASKVVRGQKIKVYSKVSGKGSSSESKNRSSSRLPKQYKVKKGDSMKSIASKFGISLSQLKKKNKKSKSGLKAGQTLRIQ